jgi:hypothetical protein
MEDGMKTTASQAGSTAPGGLAGTLWFAGWLFTIGFARLVWWKAVVALAVWPYFLALALRGSGGG